MQHASQSLVLAGQALTQHDPHNYFSISHPAKQSFSYSRLFYSTSLCSIQSITTWSISIKYLMKKNVCPLTPKLSINQGKIPTTHYTNVTIVYTFALWRSMFVPVFQPYTCEHMGHCDSLLLGTAMHLVHLVVCTEMNVPVFQPQAHTHVHMCVYMCVAA